MEKQAKEPANWREYIKTSFTALRQWSWIWREFMSLAGRRLFVWILLVVLIDSFFSVVWPYLFKGIIDGLAVRAIAIIVWSFVAIAAFEVFGQGCDWVRNRLEERLGAEQIVTLETRLTELFFGKSLGQHLGDSQELSPANVKKGQNAVRSLQKIMLYQLIPTSIKVVLFLGLLFWLHWITGLVALAFIFYSAGWSLYLNRHVMTVGQEIDEELRAVDRYIDERWRGVERVKTSGKELEESERYFQMNREVNNKATRFWMWYHFMNHIRAQTSSSPFFVSTIAIGIWLVLSGDWTIGTLLPFTFWVGGFINAVDQMRGIERQINGQLPAINTLKRLMELEPAVQDAPDATYFTADSALSVQVKQISFAHPSKDDGSPMRVLQDVSFSIRPGQKVAIIGPSGVGKTTLLHMLLRSRDPDKGQVLLDGHDLRQLKQASFKRFIGYAPQGAPLFDGTIRELMLYGLDPEHRSRTSDDEIWVVLRAVKADFGERLNNGLDTKIGRDGLELSGGERQRLSAAMALMNPLLRLLIMDEPTSNLDSETQKGFQDGLNAVLERGVTAIIVAHRLSTVMDCDRFIVLKPVDELAAGESQVEAVAGSFSELYNISPTFRRVAENEGLKILPEISVQPGDVPTNQSPLLFGDQPIDFRA